MRIISWSRLPSSAFQMKLAAPTKMWPWLTAPRLFGSRQSEMKQLETSFQRCLTNFLLFYRWTCMDFNDFPLKWSDIEPKFFWNYQSKMKVYVLLLPANNSQFFIMLSHNRHGKTSEMRSWMYSDLNKATVWMKSWLCSGLYIRAQVKTFGHTWSGYTVQSVKSYTTVSQQTSKKHQTWVTV